jgi:hypothetical protein
MLPEQVTLLPFLQVPVAPPAYAGVKTSHADIATRPMQAAQANRILFIQVGSFREGVEKATPYVFRYERVDESAL